MTTSVSPAVDEIADAMRRVREAVASRELTELADDIDMIERTLST